MNDYMDDEYDAAGVGDLMGEEGMFLSEQQAASADVASLPKVLLMGPRRGGKTSIQVRLDTSSSSSTLSH